MEIIVFETRLEGITFTPLILAIQKTEELNCVFVNTEQHYRMLDQVLPLFSISSTYDLKWLKGFFALVRQKRKTPFIEKTGIEYLNHQCEGVF